MKTAFGTILVMTAMLATLAWSGCGKKSTTTADSDLVSAAARTAADEVAESIADNDAALAPFVLESLPNASDSSDSSLLAATVTRACTTGTGGAATVAVTFTGTDTGTFTKTNATTGNSISFAFDTTRTGTETRVWTPAAGGSALACNTGATHVVIPWSTQGADLSMTATLARTINRTKTLTWTKAGTPTTKIRTDNVDVAGTRTVTYGAVTTGTSTYTRTHTIARSVTRTRNFMKLDGSAVSLISTVVSPATDPIRVTVVRNKSGGTLVTKTVDSGTIQLTGSDGTVQSCVFSGVVYSFTSNNDKCLPTAGTITCSNFASATETSPNSTIVIKFGETTDSSVSISTDGGAAVDFPEYNSKGCDLESSVV